MARRVSIQTKIVAPFLVLFLVATLLAALAMMRVASQREEDLRRRKALDAVRLFGTGGVPVSRRSLTGLADILHVELVYRDAQRPEITTLTGADADAFTRALDAAGVDVSVASPIRTARTAADLRALPLVLAGEPHMAFYAAVETLAASGGGRPVLFVLLKESELSEAKRRAAQPIVLIAAVSLVAALGVGLWIARAITRPVRRLAEVTREIAAGQLDKRAEVTTGDELAELAESFNIMVESLRESQARAVGAERLAAIGELATGVAHEIRNPLCAIRMNVQMLRDSAGGEDRETLGTLLDEIDRLELAVEDLLTFARPRAPEREPTDTAAVVRSALDLMARQLDHARVTVRTEIADDLPPLRAEPGRIKQVAINLIINAMNAMVRGGEIGVALRREDGALVFDVRDNGEGIDPELGARVFDPFVTTRAKGTGLGLAVSKQIVEAHGGTITFHPAGEGGGTVFRVRLPLEG